MTTFTMTLAQSIYDSNEQFPIDFDDAWQWLGYARKDSAKRTLVQNFEKDFDFHINVELGSLDVPRAVETVTISIDCFKQLAMMAKTDVGKVARRYFIECEKIAKEARTVSLDVTQGLVNELYDSTKVICYNDTLADMALHGSLQYQKKLNPKKEVTVRVELIRAKSRLDCSKPRSMGAVECEYTINKQFRQTQDAMEGYDSVPIELRPKKERADIKRARELNPSSMEQKLFALTPLSQDELAMGKDIDLSTIKDPTRFGEIEQPPLIQGNNNSSLPQLPEGFVIDIPLDNIH